MANHDYTPPKVWTWHQGKTEGVAKLNRPIAGSTFEQDLPQGDHPLQLYSLGTPNGQKVTIMLEELLEQGINQAEYDAFYIDIGNGDQFSSGFVEINPNSKIPALYDKDKDVRVFESGAILLYLAEKYQRFLPDHHQKRTECLNWLFWLQGSAPYLGGGFGHFYHYAPQKIQYAVDRFTMEAKRQLDVLDRHLKNRDYMVGDEYSIADMVIWPWYGNLVLGRLYDAAEFLQVHEYKNVVKWAEMIDERPAVKRGRIVNRTWTDKKEGDSEGAPQLKERHSRNDFDAFDL